MIGGDGELLESLTENATPNIVMTGWTTPAEIWSASDIALLTSDNEAQPLSLVEAASAGLPLIGEDVGSVSEVILNHETGIVTNKNAGSIASAIESLILDKTTRDEMGRLATARAQALFSVDRMINAHIELYKSIVK